MTTGDARTRAAAATVRLEAELAAVIGQIPPDLRSPIFMPTERVPLHRQVEGLWKVRDLYAYELESIYRPRLQALKRARKGRRCFILGNGPSIARTDLSRLKGEATFATNGFFLKMPELDWTPTYYVVEDHLVGEDRADELKALTGTTKLFPASLAYAVDPGDDTVFFNHRPRISYPDGFDFSFDADEITFSGGTVTFTCMQLAAYLGFQEIYVVGVDADYAIPTDARLSGRARVREIDMDSDDANHFHPNYFGKGKRWHEPNVEVMLGAYAEARRATESRGISIVNATIGGKLEVFPRIDYEMLFRPAPAERLLILDQRAVGDGTATGEVKAAVLGNWPADQVMQVYDRGAGELRIVGSPPEDEGHDLLDRVTAFGPDLILYRPTPRKQVLHDMAMDLIQRTSLPLAVWIVDDWPSAHALEDPVSAAALETDFRALLRRADARFSISPGMSAAFHERYGYSFVPIANGIDPTDWPTATVRDAGTVKVRYAGSLAENMTLASVELVARVIEELAQSGVDISFEIKSHSHWVTTNTAWVTGLKHTSVSTSDLPAAEYRRWLADADINLIAYNFDDASRTYIRYSIANKLPECLASGAAVLGVGPDDVGTISTMAALGVGELVTVNDPRAIAGALRTLVASPKLRYELARRSQDVAFSVFSLDGVRQAFDASVGRVAAAHRAGEYPRDLHAHVDETEIVATLLDDRRGVEHVLVDVGAHRGSSAVHFDRLGWSVECFEPQQANREVLAARFADRDNVHIDPRAVGDERATNVPLYESSESSGITSLSPFHASHHAEGEVEVTTMADIVDEKALSAVDFLKIDVEGLDLAVLRGVPWSRLRPDVVECEFEDLKTLALGHSWRDIATFLLAQGYTVYVSEWHPVLRYGTRHDWRRVVPYTDDLELPADAWGNLVAFQADPGWTLVQRAFDRNIKRGSPQPAAPARSHAPASQQAAAAGLARRRRAQDRGRPLPIRVATRGARMLWRQRRWTIPAAVLLGLWTLAGFLPALAPFALAIWGSAGLAAVAAMSVLASYRLHRRTRRMSKEISRLRTVTKTQQQKLAEARARLVRLERARSDSASASAELLRRVRVLEDSIERPDRGHDTTTPADDAPVRLAG